MRVHIARMAHCPRRAARAECVHANNGNDILDSPWKADVALDTFSGLLFFIDETWQEIEGRNVAALGGVAISQRGYNAFCREVFALKRDVLGAVELRDAELKGKKCFANRVFRRQREGHRTRLLEAADGLFGLLGRHHARTFVTWTTDPELISLRSTHTTQLSKAYIQQLFGFRAYMQREAPRQLGPTGSGSGCPSWSPFVLAGCTP